MITKVNNIKLNGQHKPIVADIYFKKNQTPKPVIILCHGYKGFKDWGAWSLVGDYFAQEDFVFIKFNFSHNGGTVENPIDFPDLEAFAQNNYIKELDDLNTVINWVFDNNGYSSEIDARSISLVGHSRGAGIVVIKAEEDTRITSVLTWAGVSDYKARFQMGTPSFKTWQETGITYIENSRTKQNMPHHFQFFENFKENEQRLTIKRAVEHLQIPHLILHGTNDAAVSHLEAEALHRWNSDSNLSLIDDANHTFGATHPWHLKTLPEDLEKVSSISINFIKITLEKKE